MGALGSETVISRKDGKDPDFNVDDLYRTIEKNAPLYGKLEDIVSIRILQKNIKKLEACFHASISQYFHFFMTRTEMEIERYEKELIKNEHK